MSRSILVVDDDPVQRRMLEAAVGRFGYRAVTADDGEAALKALESDRSLVTVILDLVMPGLDGLEVLRRMGERDLRVPVIVQTAKGGVETVVSAMRAGAFDFVVKPASPDKLRTAIEQAVKVETFGGRSRRTRKRGPGTITFDDIVTDSARMERVLSLSRKAAAAAIPILIEGESGVGKELVARAIQSASDRRGRPFVTVNCGAIPDNLVESILFGHEKGAFTGATEKHVGKFVEADGGTLFLDEIGDLPLHVQVKLLRAVQEGEVDPVGARSPVKVDIRLISATHRDLVQRVREGLFREDLFYRLNVFPILVPPLRARREDVPRLAGHFVKRISAAQTGSRVRGIAPDALDLLQAYDWPGNIRQLENAILRAVVLCEGELLTKAEFPQISAQIEGIELEELAPPGRAVTRSGTGTADRAIAAGDTEADTSRNVASLFGVLEALDERGNVRPLADIENEMIRLALDHYNGQMSEVARRLGIGRSTLYRKLKEMGIDPEQPRGERAAS